MGTPTYKIWYSSNWNALNNSSLKLNLFLSYKLWIWNFAWSYFLKYKRSYFLIWSTICPQNHFVCICLNFQWFSPKIFEPLQTSNKIAKGGFIKISSEQIPNLRVCLKSEKEIVKPTKAKTKAIFGHGGVSQIHYYALEFWGRWGP